MKLVLYSGGQEKRNQKLHKALVQLAGDKSKKKMTYMPYCNEGANLFFYRASRRYESYGVSHFHKLLTDQEMFEKDLRQALSSDIIYLAGGNTFYFLHHIRKQGLMPRLRAFVKKGGVLAGLSAGAIIMTPNINLAGIPKFNADPNDIRLRDLKALNLTNFEFYPHYYVSAKLDKELKKYSNRTENPIYACPDGSGIIVNGPSITFNGPVFVFHRGDKYRL